MRNFTTIIALLIFASVCQAATISGFVTDKASGEPLLYAMIGVKNTDLGVVSNKKGYYILNNVPTGDVEVTVRKIGYRKFTTTVHIDNAREQELLNVELEEQAVVLDGIKVSGDRKHPEINTREIQVSSTSLQTSDLKEVISFAEADVFHSLMALPGVAPISDFSSGLYVRGGSADQNLILIDGIDVYNPSHFGGLFSTFNTDAVKDVELLKGGFPAQYGGRLSSVLDVTNKDGNRKQFKGVARLSAISTSATLETPWKIGKQSGSAMASFRRTYLELVKSVIDTDIDYYFYDGHAKVNWDYSPRDKFSFSTYFGKDVLGMNVGMDMDISWGNETFSAQWTHVFNSQLFSHFLFAGSHFNSTMNGDSDSGEYFKRLNDIYDNSMKGSMTWQPVEEHMIDYGFDVKFNDVTYKVETNTNVDPGTLPNIEVSSATSAVYVQDSWDLDAFWTVQPGLRFTWNNSESDYLEGHPTADNTNLEPRISVRRKLTPRSNVYVSYGRYHQYLSQLSADESSPLDLWFPIDKSVEPGRADHYIFGYKSEWFGQLGFELEGYYKDYRNLQEYKIETEYEWDNSQFLGDVLNMGRGYAYGADLLLRNDWNGMSGFIGYAYGVTKRKINRLNINPENGNEQYYYPRYDRTHQMNIIETYKYSEYTGRKFLGSDLSVNVSYSYMTGQPTSKPEEVYYDGENLQFFYSYRDRERLPAYSRLDLSINTKWYFKHWSLEPYLQFINVFNHKNVWYREYIPHIDENQNITIEKKDVGQFPFIPLIGFNAEW
jgi:outer membrane receptor protein involved in Fe transport